jgi:transcription elongation factor GreA
VDETVITRAGLARLSDELERLTGEGRREIAERLKRAVANETNQAENADYLAVRDDQVLLERRIAQLEERLLSAQLSDPDPENGRVDVGERVRLRALDSGKRLEVELVGRLEADPSRGRISIASPLGKALLGLRRGEIADVEAPRGKLRYKILAVTTPALEPA